MSVLDIQSLILMRLGTDLGGYLVWGSLSFLSLKVYASAPLFLLSLQDSSDTDVRPFLRPLGH